MRKNLLPIVQILQLMRSQLPFEAEKWLGKILQKIFKYP